jgi:hypothetical protein
MVQMQQNQQSKNRRFDQCISDGVGVEPASQTGDVIVGSDNVCDDACKPSAEDRKSHTENDDGRKDDNSGKHFGLNQNRDDIQ